jgi:hypothetical protein
MAGAAPQPTLQGEEEDEEDEPAGEADEGEDGDGDGADPTRPRVGGSQRPHEEEDAVAGMTYEQLQALQETAGFVSRGLAPETLALLPRGTLSQVRRAAARAAAAASAAAAVADAGGGGAVPAAVREPEARCAICCCDYDAEEGEGDAAASAEAAAAAAAAPDPAPDSAPPLLLVLPCGHSFHDECAGRWLGGERKACPTCSAEVEGGPAREAAERWLMLLQGS